MAKITVLGVGSRGDTQPYIALALGLQEVGYEINLVASDDFAKFVTSYGLTYYPLGVNIQEFVEDKMQNVLGSGRNIISAIREIIREGMTYASVMDEHIGVACENTDLIIGNLIGGIFGQQYAQKMNVPYIWATTIPLPGRTSEYPALPIPQNWRLGKPFNRFTHVLLDQMMWQGFRGMINRWRKRENIATAPFFHPPWYEEQGQSIPTLYCYSQHILPAPADWPATSQVTGYWFLDRDTTWEPTSEVVEFIEGGSPPVYIGFGSMAGRNPEKTTQIALEALALSGQRGILASGWGAMHAQKLPENVSVLQSIPHDWLFPQMAAVVHHGGAGTIGASLRAGVPTLVVPFFGDQPFWGDRIHALGLGPKPIPHKKLTAKKLAEAIQQAVTDTTIQQNAKEIGERIRAENGVQNAVNFVKQILPLS